MNGRTVLFGLVAIMIIYVAYRSLNENFEYDTYPLGISTVKVTPYNQLIDMPNTVGHVLSTDQCLGRCSENKLRPRVLREGSTMGCTLACSTK